MIHEIRANKESFRTITFTEGLNVILADRSEASSKKDTRNGLGKSTLIEIIHFCLGSKVTRGKGLRIMPLEEWEFTMILTLGEERITVTRKVAVPNIVNVSGLEKEWVGIPSPDLLGNRSLTITQWKTLLGETLFSLSALESTEYKPSFRSLISYFVRRNHHAFGDPFSHFHSQKPWDVQLHIALLLGLEWRNAVKWQQIKDKDKNLKELRRIINRGVLPYFQGSIGELEAEQITLSQEVEDCSQALENFRVHPQYESIQKEANHLTEELHSATNTNVLTKRRLVLYQQSTESEAPPSGESIEKVYEEMGIVFSETILKSLSEAKEFYSQVIRDRHRFLVNEISRLEHDIAETDSQIRTLTDARAELMQILSDHGALKEMDKLRELHVAKCEELERVKTQIKHLREMNASERQIALDKAKLTDIATRDHEERRETWNLPVGLFNRNSQALYRSPGHLIINLTDSGFKFNIEITKSGSKGVDKMKIFCFDLSILEFSANQGLSIDFLVHDSQMFDGVDSRQRAAALERSLEITANTGTQYICALNSDMIPYGDFSEEFDIEKYVRCRLSDEDESGTLLGIFFNPSDDSADLSNH